MTTPDPNHPAPVDSIDHDALRPHSYDGIQEYDKRLPRWWLFTLYGAMAFALFYWAYYETYDLGSSPAQVLESRMAENTAREARSSGGIDDGAIWEMSRNPQTVAAGKATFESTCAACHKADLTGLIGPNLLDHEWIHGGKPIDVIKTITEGSQLKGMPTWGPLLGKQKITEVAAFIFSHHQRGEEIIPVAGWTPLVGAVPPPASTP